MSYRRSRFPSLVLPSDQSSAARRSPRGTDSSLMGRPPSGKSRDHRDPLMSGGGAEAVSAAPTPCASALGRMLARKLNVDKFAAASLRIEGVDQGGPFRDGGGPN